jgi:hypothetical protein
VTGKLSFFVRLFLFFLLWDYTISTVFSGEKYLFFFISCVLHQRQKHCKLVSLSIDPSISGEQQCTSYAFSLFFSLVQEKSTIPANFLIKPNLIQKYSVRKCFEIVTFCADETKIALFWKKWSNDAYKIKKII